MCIKGRGETHTPMVLRPSGIHSYDANCQTGMQDRTSRVVSASETVATQPLGVDRTEVYKAGCSDMRVCCHSDILLDFVAFMIVDIRPFRQKDRLHPQAAHKASASPRSYLIVINAS